MCRRAGPEWDGGRSWPQYRQRDGGHAGAISQTHSARLHLSGDDGGRPWWRGRTAEVDDVRHPPSPRREGAGVCEASVSSHAGMLPWFESHNGAAMSTMCFQTFQALTMPSWHELYIFWVKLIFIHNSIYKCFYLNLGLMHGKDIQLY